MYSFLQPPDPPEEDESERYERHVAAEFDAWWMSGTYPMRKYDRLTDAGVSEEAAQEIWFASRESKNPSVWVKCSDRLPAYNEKVLACFMTVLGTQQVTTAELNHQKRCASPDSQDYDDTWYVTVGLGHKIKPTHWMPLPALPALPAE